MGTGVTRTTQVEAELPTLHIEHAISDLTTWKQAYDRFAEKRASAGVAAARLHQPADDPQYIVLQLDFPSVAQAAGFKAFLETSVWTSPDRSPGLVGIPRVRILLESPL